MIYEDYKEAHEVYKKECCFKREYAHVTLTEAELTEIMKGLGQTELRQKLQKVGEEIFIW